MLCSLLHGPTTSSWGREPKEQEEEREEGQEEEGGGEGEQVDKVGGEG